METADENLKQLEQRAKRGTKEVVRELFKSVMRNIYTFEEVHKRQPEFIIFNESIENLLLFIDKTEEGYDTLTIKRSEDGLVKIKMQLKVLYSSTVELFELC